MYFLHVSSRTTRFNKSRTNVCKDIFYNNNISTVIMKIIINKLISELMKFFNEI